MGTNEVFVKSVWKQATALAVVVASIVVGIPAHASNEPATVRVVPFDVVAPDGVHLRGHVYLPEGEGPFATVLELSRYWGNVAGRSETPEGDGTGNQIRVPTFLNAGFAFAAISVRGTGGSGGCLDWEPRDSLDAYTVIEGLASQPWSNGNVGMFGLSASAWTQFQAIGMRPPSLKAAVPASGVIDLWSTVTRHGAASDPHAQAYYTPIVALSPFSDPNPGHFACREHAEMLEASAQLAIDGAKTAYFEERDYREAMAGTEVPVFATNGLSDLEGHILQFEGLWDLLGGDRRLQLFQGQHGYSPRKDFLEQAVAWFDHYLRGAPQTVTSGVVEYQDDTLAWHTASRWPPRSKETTLYLSGQEIVDRSKDIEESSQTFRALTDPCVEALCGGKKAPDNVYTVRCGSGAVYLSPPLSQEVEITGNFTLDLNVQSDQPGGNLAAMLFHVPADEACPVFDGKEVRRAIMELRHWKEEGKPQPFPVGAPTDLRMVSHPLASVVPAGHRLVLVLGDSDEVLPSRFKPELTISSDASDPSSITLPIVEGRLRFVE